VHAGLDGMDTMGFRSPQQLADPYGRQAQMQGGAPGQGYGAQQAMPRQAYPQGPYAQPIWAASPVQVRTGACCACSLNVKWLLLYTQLPCHACSCACACVCVGVHVHVRVCACVCACACVYV
jgi:hypothetical protein